MPTFTADWILPIAGPPIRDGYVTVDDGRIRGVGQGESAGATALGSVAILPALVNAHTHLELSYLHARVPPCPNFNDWVSQLMAIRREFPDPHASPIVDAARAAIARARATGTGLVGDISNTLVTAPLLRDAGMPGHIFYELLGFNHPDPAGKVREARAAVDTVGADDREVRVSLAPHAPYSVSPALFMAIHEDVATHPPSVTSVHLGESRAEVELLRHGTGPTRDMLERFGVWTSAWQVPGVSPTEYLGALGFLTSRSLLVHGVQFTADDLVRVRTAGAPLVSCPRSNTYVGVGAPPLESFYAAGVRVAFGTDSLASCTDLDMFAELAEARRIAPAVPARELLRSATLTGAEVLAYDEDYGSIETGKRAALIGVRVPPHVTDVEEYLVGGLASDAVMWLDSASVPQASTFNPQ